MKKVLKVRPSKEKVVFENLPEAVDFLNALGIPVEETEEEKFEELLESAQGLEQ